MDTNRQAGTDIQTDSNLEDILRLAIALGRSVHPTWAEGDAELVAVKSAGAVQDEAWTAVWGG